MAELPTAGRIVAVARAAGHDFSKPVMPEIRLVAGLGVEGDAHAGATVKHRSRVAADPAQPNLRQIHLIARELIDELREGGFDVSPGGMGENVTTAGLALLDLPQGTRLALGPDAVVEVTGLRNPCRQLNTYRAGLMQAVLGRDESGGLVVRAGIMAVVVAGGAVQAGDPIAVSLPEGPHVPLKIV